MRTVESVTDSNFTLEVRPISFAPNSAIPDVRDNFMDRAMLPNMALAIKKYLESVQKELEIKIHEDSGKIVVKVIESKTGETIRQIPSEDLLKILSNIDQMLGSLIDAKV